jgi:hypothetical protein
MTPIDYLNHPPLSTPRKVSGIHSERELSL